VNSQKQTKNDRAGKQQAIPVDRDAKNDKSNPADRQIVDAQARKTDENRSFGKIQGYGHVNPPQVG
jgi:hypothetical protein